MTQQERAGLIARYGAGVALLKQALAEVPPKAMRWKPAPDKWSVHEVVVHCADSETNAAMRIRYLVAEDNAVIQGYDQDRWVKACDYESQSLDLALAQVAAVRAWTHAFICPAAGIRVEPRGNAHRNAGPPVHGRAVAGDLHRAPRDPRAPDPSQRGGVAGRGELGGARQGCMRARRRDRAARRCSSRRAWSC